LLFCDAELLLESFCVGQNEMVSLKYDNERLQQLIQQKGINPSAVLNQQNTSSSEHRLSLGDPAGLGK